METVVKELFLKVTCIEIELNNVKLNMSNKTNLEDSNKDKETYQASEGNTNTEKPLEVTIESEINKEKTDKIDSKEFKCSKCEYM